MDRTGVSECDARSWRYASTWRLTICCVLNRRATSARHVRRSMRSIARTASASAGRSVHRYPVSPSVMISAAAPRGVVMTGVPVARASIMTRPNGSGHWIGFREGGGCAEEPVLLDGLHLTEVVDPVDASWRDLAVVEPDLLGLAHLRGDEQPRASGSGNVDRLEYTFGRVHPTQEQQVATAIVAAVRHLRGSRRRRCRGGSRGRC